MQICLWFYLTFRVLLSNLYTVKKGEEIFEDYAYDMNYDDTPRWYREEHEKFYGVHEKS